MSDLPLFVPANKTKLLQFFMQIIKKKHQCPLNYRRRMWRESVSHLGGTRTCVESYHIIEFAETET